MKTISFSCIDRLAFAASEARRLSVAPHGLAQPTQPDSEWVATRGARLLDRANVPRRSRRSGLPPGVTTMMTAAMSCGLLLALLPGTAWAELNFQPVILDQTYIAYERDVGDIDGDGRNDLVAVQEGDANLQVFRAPTWARSTLVTFTGTFRYPRADDFKLADINGDGKLDVVTRLGAGPSDDGAGVAVWCENLGGGTNFVQHLIGNSPEYVKDIVVADFDRDGRLDVALRMDTRTQLWLQETNGWTEVMLNHEPHEGLEAADVDMDGDPDLVLNGFWFATPNTPAACRSATNYIKRTIDSAWFTQTGDWTANSCKVAVADMDGDGINDVIFSDSERPGYAVAWYRSATPNGAGPWIKHPVAVVDYCHTLQAADFDLDGKVDLLVGGMIQSQHRGLKLLLNGGTGTNWTELVIQTNGSYSAEIGEIDNDGDLDIVGIRNWNSAPTYIYRNNAANRLDRWTYIEVDNNRAKWGDFAPPDWLRYFGLAMGDLTGDGMKDIVSGRYFYRNPGGDMTGKWERVDFGANVDAILTTDVDGDEFADVIALALPDIYWLEAGDRAGSKWTMRKVATAPKTGHVNSQGFALGQVIPGGRPEIVLTTEEGLYYFEIPERPEQGPWARTLVTTEASAEGLDLADMDGDGWLDVIAGHAEKYVAWWKNPGPGKGSWTRHILGTTPHLVDRVRARDLNGDGRLDVVVTEERYPGKEPDANLFWFEQPKDPSATDWPRHRLITTWSLNSLDVADMDGDGDFDIITGEHKGPDLKLYLFENDGHGHFTERVLDKGKESHLGTLTADLDGDGDLDIVSIAWDNYKPLHLWRNDSPRRGTTAVELRELPRETRRLLPLLPPREERAGERRAVPTSINSPLPNPLPVRRGEGETASLPPSFLNSTVVRRGTASGQVVTSSVSEWGVVQATLGDGPEADGTILLENRAIRVRYTAKRFRDGNKDHVIVDFLVKKTNGQLAVGRDSQLDGIWMNADEGRGKLTAARVVHDGPDRKTLRVEWDRGKVIQEFTLWPDRPVIRIDYLKYGINIVDLVTSVDAFEVHGAQAWQEARAKVTDDALLKIANPHHRLTTNLYPAYPFPIIAAKDWGKLEPKELTYHGHLILGAYQKDTGLGFGRVLPAQDANYLKLLNMGFEVFANWRQSHRPFTGYLYAVTGGPEELTSVGKAIADDAAAGKADVRRADASTPTPRASEVRLTENAVDESAGGAPCYKIETPTATYFLEKIGAGFTSIVDQEGHDWLGFDPTPGSGAGGEFRGFPNAVDYPTESYFHAHNAGTAPSTTKVELNSPDRVSISAVSSNGLWACRYDFFPTHGTFTMTRMPQDGKYWVLYEGTPGGQFDETDWWMTSAVSQPKPMTQPHEGDIPAPEWIVFGDPRLSRVLFLLHHEDDAHPDRFYQMDKKMTVFGFGRQGMDRFLDRVPQSVSIGFLETTNHADIRRALDKLPRPASATRQP